MILFVFGIILVVAGICLSAVCYRLVFRSPNIALRDPYAIPPGKQYELVADELLQRIYQLEQLPYEQVFITAWDGTRLAARYYRFYDEAPVQIFFHGYRSNAVREFSCGYRLAQKLGFNALVVDQRAHGNSQGHTISFGIYERYDCLDWCNYARERFGENTRTFLMGVSMGAATVLMASDLELPENVACIIADCPYSSAGRIIRKIIGDLGLPVSLAYPFVVTGALLFGRFRIWESSPVRSVGKSRVPILIFHGYDDRFVPCDMSKVICDACAGEKKLVYIAGAGHGLSYITDPDRYEVELGDFLRGSGVPIK